MGRINIHILDDVHNKLLTEARQKLKITFERHVNNILKLASVKGIEKLKKI